MNKEEEFIELIQSHSRIIHKVIGLYIDEYYEREDLYQEITLQAWKSFSNFKNKSKFSTWLYKVALNTVFSYNKKTNKSKTVELDNAIERKITTAEKKDYEILHFLVKKLNEVDRMLMSLHLDGYKNNEIAEIIGLTTNNINVKIHRLKNQIVEQYKNAINGYL